MSGPVILEFNWAGESRQRRFADTPTQSGWGAALSFAWFLLQLKYAAGPAREGRLRWLSASLEESGT